MDGNLWIAVSRIVSSTILILLIHEHDIVHFLLSSTSSSSVLILIVNVSISLVKIILRHFLKLLFLFVCLFWYKVSLCRSGCCGTCYVTRTHRHIHVSSPEYWEMKGIHHCARLFQVLILNLGNGIFILISFSVVHFWYIRRVLIFILWYFFCHRIKIILQF